MPYLGLDANPGIGFAGDKLSSTRKSSDIEFAHNFRPFKRHLITWGLNYHRTSMDINDSATVRFSFDDGDDSTLDLASGFIQDQIKLWPGGELTLGTKLEWNTFTDWNVQPSIRLAHRFDDETTMWGSIMQSTSPNSCSSANARFVHIHTRAKGKYDLTIDCLDFFIPLVPQTIVS